MRISTGILFVAASVIALPVYAATPVADATYQGNLNYVSSDPGVVYTAPGSYEYGGGHSRLTIMPTPSPYIESSVSSGSSGMNLNSTGQIRYQVVLNGAADSGPVPVDVYYTISGSAMYSGLANANSFADLRLVNNTDNFDLLASGATAPEGGTFDQSSVWQVSWTPGSLGDVVMNASSAANVCITSDQGNCGGPDGFAVASAYVDPVFRVDPAFAAAHPGYSFAFSRGVGNDFIQKSADPVSGAPEPASWSLMISGVGAAGAMLRRRRGSLATA